MDCCCAAAALLHRPTSLPLRLSAAAAARSAPDRARPPLPPGPPQADVGSHPNLLTALDALLRGETADALSAAMHRAQQAAEQQQLQAEQEALAAARLSPQASPQSSPAGGSPSATMAAAAAAALPGSPGLGSPAQQLAAEQAAGAAAAAGDLRQQVLELLAALEGSVIHPVEEEGCAHLLLSLQQLLAARELPTRIMVLQVGRAAACLCCTRGQMPLPCQGAAPGARLMDGLASSPQAIWALASAPQGADALLAADSGALLPTLAALLRHPELPLRAYAAGALAAICQNTLQVRRRRSCCWDALPLLLGCSAAAGLLCRCCWAALPLLLGCSAAAAGLPFGAPRRAAAAQAPASSMPAAACVAVPALRAFGPPCRRVAWAPSRAWPPGWWR